MPVPQDDLERSPVVPNALLALIPRFRWVYFGLVALLFVAAFNGQWRVGRDSAAYRGLGHQLAATGKYVFRDKQTHTIYSDQQDTRYPGLPLVLAGVEKTFGRRDAAAVLAIVLMAVVTLFVCYRLAKSALPAWLAVAVVFGMGANGRFLEHANEVLSDVPFLLGMVLALWSFGRLQSATTARQRVLMIVALVLALVFSAAMRPTFWVFAVALVATCFWGLWRPIRRGETPDDARPRRLACGMTLGVIAITGLVFFLVIRGKGGHGYEQKLADRLSDVQRKVLLQLPPNIHELLEQSLPESFFGTQFGPGFIPVWTDARGHVYKLGLSSLLALAVVAAGVLLVHRNVLWGLTVAATILTMAMLGSVPRYFIMILPLLLAGWGLLVERLAGRMRVFPLREAAGFIGLGLVVAPNLLDCADLIREQHGYSRPQQGLKHVGFLQAYHGGKWAGVDAVAKMIQENVKPDQKVVGPEATVLTYLSDRDVFGLGMLLPRFDRGGIWEQKIPRLGFTAAVFPDKTDKLYDDKDVLTGKLIRMGMIKPTRTLAAAGGYRLSEFQVVSLGLRGSHKGKSLATTQPARPRGKTAATTRSTTQPGGKKHPSTQPPARPKRPGTRPTTLPLKAVSHAGAFSAGSASDGSTELAEVQSAGTDRFSHADNFGSERGLENSSWVGTVIARSDRGGPVDTADIPAGHAPDPAEHGPPAGPALHDRREPLRSGVR
jgi:hypothetical protein